MRKHPDCEDRCQLLEHKGYHNCSQTGRCEQLDAASELFHIEQEQRKAAAQVVPDSKSADGAQEVQTAAEPAAATADQKAAPQERPTGAWCKDSTPTTVSEGSFDSTGPDQRGVEPTPTSAGAAPGPTGGMPEEGPVMCITVDGQELPVAVVFRERHQALRAHAEQLQAERNNLLWAAENLNEEVRRVCKERDLAQARLRGERKK